MPQNWAKESLVQGRHWKILSFPHFEGRGRQVCRPSFWKARVTLENPLSKKPHRNKTKKTNKEYFCWSVWWYTTLILAFERQSRQGFVNSRPACEHKASQCYLKNSVSETNKKLS